MTNDASVTGVVVAVPHYRLVNIVTLLSAGIITYVTAREAALVFAGLR